MAKVITSNRFGTSKKRDQEFTLSVRPQNLKIVETTKRHIEDRVGNPILFCLLIFIY
jgi:Ethanolamine utilization protein EutJ (predicted chaperonin)